MRAATLFILFLFIAATSEAADDERSPDVPTEQVTVRLREYRFEPARIELKAGQPVELTLVNEGTVLHEFVTEALHNLSVDIEVNGVEADTHGLEELEIPPKTKVVLRFTAPKDHFKEGMVGKLIIR